MSDDQEQEKAQEDERRRLTAEVRQKFQSFFGWNDCFEFHLTHEAQPLSSGMRYLVSHTSSTIAPPKMSVKPGTRYFASIDLVYEFDSTLFGRTNYTLVSATATCLDEELYVMRDVVRNQQCPGSAVPAAPLRDYFRRVHEIIGLPFEITEAIANTLVTTRIAPV
jgi:hypothetical protein